MPETPKRSFPFNILRGGRAAEKDIDAGKHDAQLDDLVCYSRAHAPDMTPRIEARLRALGRRIVDRHPRAPTPPAPTVETGSMWNLLRGPDAEQRILRGEADKNLEETYQCAVRHVPGLVATLEERFGKLRKPVPEVARGSVFIPDPRNYTDDPNERRRGWAA